jgi:hypothetical protein
MNNPKKIPMFDTEEITLDADKNWFFGTHDRNNRHAVNAAQAVGELRLPTEQVRIIDAGRIAFGKLVGVSSQWVLVQGDIFERDPKGRVYRFPIEHVGFDLGVERRCEVKLKQVWIDDYLSVEGWKYRARKAFIDKMLVGNARMELLNVFSNGAFRVVAIEKTESDRELASILSHLFHENDLDVVSGSTDDYRVSLRDLYDEQLKALEQAKTTDKIEAMLAGEAVVIGDDWLDQHDLPDGIVTIPNPNRVGIKDQYLAGLATHPLIHEYRVGQGIADSDEGLRMG